MAFAVFTFALCVTLILGTYWYLIVRPETEDAQVVAKRVRSLNQPLTNSGGVTTAETKVSNIPALEAILKRNEKFTASIQHMLTEADVEMSPGVFLALS